MSANLVTERVKFHAAGFDATRLHKDAVDFAGPRVDGLPCRVVAVWEVSIKDAADHFQSGGFLAAIVAAERVIGGHDDEFALWLDFDLTVEDAAVAVVSYKSHTVEIDFVKAQTHGGQRRA